MAAGAAVYSRLAAAAKTFTTGLRPWKCPPIPLRGLSTEGKSALCSAFISYVVNSISENQPPPAALPLWCLRHHLPPRGSVGRQKESAFMGRRGALLRPTCTSYAGCAQWDNKAPINCTLISYSKLSTGCCAPACGHCYLGKRKKSLKIYLLVSI